MMTRDIRVSAISYLNTAPFVYGLQHSPLTDKIEISFDYPSECARKLQNREADIGIIPVAALLSLPKYEIVSNYCIGAVGAVRTVVLLSNSPLNQIKKIYLDYQSRTSVKLVQVLSKHYWNISPEWQPFMPEKNFKVLDDFEAIVIIGDRVFEAEKHYQYVYDLSAEWYKFTGLPFVFATWTSVTDIDKEFKAYFNQSLEIGINNISEAVDSFSQLNISKLEAVHYLNNNISFELDNKKREAIELFLKMIAT